MPTEREVAGLWCGQVLERLSDYLDGELQPADRRQMEDHLRGCDLCERFGREFSDVIRSLRAGLNATEPVDDGVASRLRSRLDKET